MWYQACTQLCGFGEIDAEEPDELLLAVSSSFEDLLLSQGITSSAHIILSEKSLSKKRLHRQA